MTKYEGRETSKICHNNYGKLIPQKGFAIAQFHTA